MLRRNKNTTPKQPTSTWGKIKRVLTFLGLGGLGGLAVAGARKAHRAGATQKITGAVSNGVRKVRKPSVDDVTVAAPAPTGGDGGKVNETTIGGTPDLNQGTSGAL
jgi:hypothetical protein